jgi:hypothetical protein
MLSIKLFFFHEEAPLENLLRIPNKLWLLNNTIISMFFIFNILYLEFIAALKNSLMFLIHKSKAMLIS